MVDCNPERIVYETCDWIIIIYFLHVHLITDSLGLRKICI